MKITFVLPMYLNVPSGGFKVVYDYANSLVRRGHQVTVIHPRNIEAQNGFIQSLKSRLWKNKVKSLNHPLIPWHNVNPDVRLALVENLEEKYLPDADFVIATACETAFPVAEYSQKKGRKLYLLQSYETWSNDEDSVLSSLKLPIFKIAVSRKLYDVTLTVSECSQVTYLANGLDFSIYRVVSPITQRLTPRVAMLEHPKKEKGVTDGLRALEMVRETIPALQVIFFGTQPRGSNIPNWVEHVQLPSQTRLVEIYNSCQVFLSPSWSEGWGLPAAEAMACGCALVSADNGGVSDFAIDGDNAFIVPIQRPDLLAEKIVSLLSDNDLRHKIAGSGSKSIKRFDIELAADSLEQQLTELATRL